VQGFAWFLLLIGANAREEVWVHGAAVAAHDRREPISLSLAHLLAFERSGVFFGFRSRRASSS
jgi:hypothetical protein